LLESGATRRVDRIVTVSVPAWLQEQRVLRRSGMDRAKLRGILARQASDAQRRRVAHHVIASGHDQGRMAQEIARLLRSWHGVDGAVWPVRWAASTAPRRGGGN
jgi:dephospho-CoA kinase